MHTSTAINHSTRLIGRVHSIMSDQSRTFPTELERLKLEVYEDPAWKKLPRWARERILGTIQGFNVAAHHMGLIGWCHEFEGKRYDKFDQLPEEAKEAVRKGGKLESYHYWKKTGVRYTFFSQEKEDSPGKYTYTDTSKKRVTL
jgi:hypothetical protein